MELRPFSNLSFVDFEPVMLAGYFPLSLVLNLFVLMFPFISMSFSVLHNTSKDENK